MGVDTFKGYRLLAGANWNNRSSCGSRAVNLNNVSANVNSNNGSQLASDTFDLVITQTAVCRSLRETENTKLGSFLTSNLYERQKAISNMKRHGFLFDRICSMENLELALKKASKGKRWQTKVQKTLNNSEELLKQLQESLFDGTFRTSEYHTKTVYEPKERLIYILPFYPDRIVHHAIMNVLEPIWDSLMIHDSYSCRKGKGQHAGSTRCMEFVRNYAYCLKCDISKFYPSIDHEILKTIIKRKIKDSRLLFLLDGIIESVEGGKNAPIGNYLSQWFGNLYMNELDMFCKHELGCKKYIRYCDDFCIFSNDKKQLHQWASQIADFCTERLKLKLSKCNVFKTDMGVDFLGYRHFRKGYVLVRKSTAKRIKRRLGRLLMNMHKGVISKDTAVSKLASANGWLKHANTHNFRLAIEFGRLVEQVNGYETVQ